MLSRVLAIPSYLMLNSYAYENRGVGLGVAANNNQHPPNFYQVYTEIHGRI